MLKLSLCLLVVVAVGESILQDVNNFKLQTLIPRRIMGGWNDMPEANQHIVEMAKWSMAELAKDANEYQTADIKRIHNIRTQVVSSKIIFKSYILYLLINCKFTLTRVLFVCFWN